MNIQRLKELNMDRVLDIDEAVALSGEARCLNNEYADLDLPVPEWLEKSSNVLREEIARRTRAADLARLKDLEQELEGYKTVSERRTEASRRLAELQKKLGLTAKAAAK